MSNKLNLFETGNSNQSNEDLSINEIADKLIKERNKVLDNFAKAYIAEQKIMPSELELVVREESSGTVAETIYYFRKKTQGEESD